MVQVVSIDDVPIISGSASHQSKDVKGAQNSLLLLLLSRHFSATESCLSSPSAVDFDVTSHNLR